MQQKEVSKVASSQPKKNNAIVPTQRGNTGLKPYKGKWTSTQAIHLLRRTLFGASVEDVKIFNAMSMNEAVDDLLKIPASMPNPPLKLYASSITPGDPDAEIPQGSTWVNTFTRGVGIDNWRRPSFKNWWTGVILNQQRSIVEKMVLFWHNHFATQTLNLGALTAFYQNNVVIRKNSLGNFKEFVKAITIDPAMLRYLNGYLNNKKAPNENYGRELQELFTVGKGLDDATQTYSEEDVKAAARVLTGWSIDVTNNIPVFNLKNHDTSDKVFSSFYKGKVILGRNGPDAGALEMDDLVNMICDTDETALHICRKIYQWFVYYDINEATEKRVIVPLAKIFKSNNYEIVPVLSALFKSQHFFDQLNQGCFIKNPIDFIIGFSRGFNIQFPPPDDLINNNTMWQFFQTYAGSLQQNIGDPPSVAGWPAYYQMPQMHQLWINSDTLVRRDQFCDILINKGYSRNKKMIKVDPILFTQSLSNPSDPNSLIKDAVFYLLAIPLTPARILQIKKDILLGGQISDHYWSDAWAKFLSDPDDRTNTAIIKSKLSELYHYITTQPEYQLS